MARKNTPKVYKRVPEAEASMRTIARDLVENAGYDFDEEYDIFVTDTKRGYCSRAKKIITIPFMIDHEGND